MPARNQDTHEGPESSDDEDGGWRSRWEYTPGSDLPSPIVLVLNDNGESKEVRRIVKQIGIPCHEYRHKGTSPRYPLLTVGGQGSFRGLSDIGFFFLRKFRRRDTNRAAYG
jgi:hypothetical protein